MGREGTKGGVKMEAGKSAYQMDLRLRVKMGYDLLGLAIERVCYALVTMVATVGMTVRVPINNVTGHRFNCLLTILFSSCLDDLIAK